VWVPSVFLERVYGRALPGRVRLMRKALPHLAPAPTPRPPGGRLRFLVAFDARSSVARKNPLAAVRAFRAAFSSDRDVELVIKTTPLPAGHWGDPEGQMAAIRTAAGHDPRIRLIEALLPFPELLGLIDSATALISPHRAEGFGYLPAFALALGKPVVVTDWSGPRDFCTEDTAFPVPFRLRPVTRAETIWPTPGARWADIDADALAATLRAVADDPAAAAARAARGQALMADLYGVEAQAERYRARLEALGLLNTRPGARQILTECS
ncbi:MAG: glycosyltransferase, partial [Pseudomonadota bacterium]